MRLGKTINRSWRQIIATTMLLTMVSNTMAAEALPEYKDKSVTGVNRLDGRSTFWYYTSREDAMKVSYLHRPENICLNGEWAFNFVERPADRPADFYKADYDVSSWDKIQVPGSWPLQGYDKPLYMNHAYEFKTKNPFPAEVPDEWNPVGSYRRDFEIPASWSDKRVVIHLGAVKSSYYIWVNGERVGYSQDSKMAAEFDITPYIKVGQSNSVSVEVYRFSIGSYLEGQDMWRLAGIKRDVFVYPTEKSYVADFKVNAGLDNEYTDGKLCLDIELAGEKMKKGSAIAVELISAEGKSVYKGEIEKPTSGSNKICAEIKDCEAWSDEHPNLYTLIIEYKNGGKSSFQAAKVGFRTVELANSQMLINGKPARVKGVNRHEHHPKYGHYIPNEVMELDIELMKLHNVNAIRTCHYPADPYLYELCDKYGLFICAEANVETHGLGAALQAYYDPEKHIADNPEWEAIFHDRIFRMYERDKNHPSVIIWSMGNECGDGSIFRNGYAKLKEVDPSRLVVFEQAGTQSHTDIVGPMYMTMDKITNYARSNDTYRPLILCEYAHAMGNSLGDFTDYWDLFDSYPNLQGGFIWDWVDQGLEDYRDGVRFFDYGGAFGLQGEHNDGPFCLNGIVNPDRVPNPHAVEMKKAHEDIDVTVFDLSEREFLVRNKFNFTSTDAYDCKIELMRNGEVIESGSPVIAVAPGKSEVVKINFESEICNSAEYLLNVTFTTKKACGMIPVGHVIVNEQLALSTKQTLDYTPESGAALTFTKGSDAITVKGADFVYAVDAKSGRLSSIKVQDEEFLAGATEYDFHRVAVDNDGWDKEAKWWATADERVSLVDLTVEGEALSRKSYKSITITAKSYVDANAKERLNANFTTKYTIYGDGTIEVDNTFIPVSYHAEREWAMPRLGERYELRGDLSNSKWYGRGPGENYADRKQGSLVGHYSMDVESLTHHYIKPQESGYRTDVRNLTLCNGEGVAFNVINKNLFCFGASHYPKENYYTEDGKEIRNTVDLKRSENLFLNVDFAQKGVGGDNSWGNPVHVEYRVLMRSYHYGYYLKPTVSKK